MADSVALIAQDVSSVTPATQALSQSKLVAIVEQTTIQGTAWAMLLKVRLPAGKIQQQILSRVVPLVLKTTIVRTVVVYRSMGSNVSAAARKQPC